jgi:protein-tyrosine phosphatase
MISSLGAFIGTSYGGKRALKRHLVARTMSFFGLYSGFNNFDPRRVRRLVFVCKGNICRSAYAATRARALGFDAVSAGLEAGDGDPADKDAIRIASERGLDLSRHRTTRIGSLRLESADLLVAFEPAQAQALANIPDRNGAQVTLLGLHLPSVVPHIEDPYGLSLDYFRTCFGRVDAGTMGLLDDLRNVR